VLERLGYDKLTILDL